MKIKNKIILAAGMASMLFALSGCNVNEAYDDYVEERDSQEAEYNSANLAPVIEYGTLSTTISINTEYRYTPVANDPDGDMMIFSILNKPSWATFDGVTGTLSGTTEGHSGEFPNITISVTDGVLSSALEPFTLTVTDGNHAPTIEGVPTTQVGIDSDYYFKPHAVDVDGDTLIYSIQNKPSWISFDVQNGEMRGVSPSSEEERTNISISVSDGVTSANLAPFSITVVDGNHAPTIEGIPTSQIGGGETYHFAPTIRDADTGDILTAHIASKPSWATFDTDTGVLSGVVPDADATYEDISIYVDDGKETVYLAPFSIQVTAATP